MSLGATQVSLPAANKAIQPTQISLIFSAKLISVTENSGSKAVLLTGNYSYLAAVEKLSGLTAVQWLPHGSRVDVCHGLQHGDGVQDQEECCHSELQKGVIAKYRLPNWKPDHMQLLNPCSQEEMARNS